MWIIDLVSNLGWPSNYATLQESHIVLLKFLRHKGMCQVSSSSRCQSQNLIVFRNKKKYIVVFRSFKRISFFCYVQGGRTRSTLITFYKKGLTFKMSLNQLWNIILLPAGLQIIFKKVLTLKKIVKLIMTLYCLSKVYR